LVQELLPFVSKYRCESTFSKTKQRSRLHREAYMCVRLSNTKSDLYRQCTHMYNVTLRHVLATIVAVEKQ